MLEYLKSFSASPVIKNYFLLTWNDSDLFLEEGYIRQTCTALLLIAAERPLMKLVSDIALCLVQQNLLRQIPDHSRKSHIISTLQAVAVSSRICRMPLFRRNLQYSVIGPVHQGTQGSVQCCTKCFYKSVLERGCLKFVFLSLEREQSSGFICFIMLSAV